MTAPDPVRPVELRVLEGPNLYFTRPAVKLTLEVSGWLRAPEARIDLIVVRMGVRSAAKAGPPGSAHRLGVVARVASHLTRRLAAAEGIRRLSVRARPDPPTGCIVVAFPWRRRDASEALAREVALGMAALLSRSPDRIVTDAGRRLRATDPGAEPSVPDPAIPVVQVTGTNGKTTTVRLLAHLVRGAGLRVAYSSTDGVYRGDSELVEAGDYSGFGGAAMALAQDPDVAVLETARGGILLRGIGVMHNDVAVVTNVSADHLGLQGIHSIDQLAEVKSTITRITRPLGWDVLNADDPRVLSMRRHATGRPWLFSLDPEHPALRETLAEGGRVTTVLDGRLSWLDDEAHPLLRIVDIPVTLAGISRINLQNAMAAASAGLAVGIPDRVVARGLRIFVLDPERNPGRTNLFALDRRLGVIDYAHNEAGMIGLTQVLDALRRRGREVWIAICTAGDRTDEILHDFAFRAAVGADHLAVAELPRYLRGRPRAEIVQRLRAGALDAGVNDVPEFEDELHALREMLKDSRPGDVVGVTALGMRHEVFAWLDKAGARRLGPSDVKRVVRAVARSKGA